MKYQTISLLINFSFWCERCDLLCSYSEGDIFTCEDNMLFSNVKISSFHAKAHLVFHWCLYNNDNILFLSFSKAKPLLILFSLLLMRDVVPLSAFFSIIGFVI